MSGSRLTARRLSLAHHPTPLWHHPELDSLVGCEVWVKRDDANEGAASGNKIRKLEYLLAEAVSQKAEVVVTCGGVQSNHARATALAARRLGLEPWLLLRSSDPEPEFSGNLMLDRMAGAKVRYVSPEEYADRTRLMGDLRRELEAEGRHSYVIVEGGSNGLGALGYVNAMLELERQLRAGLAGPRRSFDAVVCACGSGGTAAGLALGAALCDSAAQVLAMAVCDDAAHFRTVIGNIVAEARHFVKNAPAPVPVTVIDDFKGPQYGVASADQKRFILDVARRTGLIVDPVYSGKALFGLANMTKKPERTLFVHTGGLPGLLAQAKEFENLV